MLSIENPEQSRGRSKSLPSFVVDAFQLHAIDWTELRRIVAAEKEISSGIPLEEFLAAYAALFRVFREGGKTPSHEEQTSMVVHHAVLFEYLYAERLREEFESIGRSLPHRNEKNPRECLVQITQNLTEILRDPPVNELSVHSESPQKDVCERTLQLYRHGLVDLAVIPGVTGIAGIVWLIISEMSRQQNLTYEGLASYARAGGAFVETVMKLPNPVAVYLLERFLRLIPLSSKDIRLDRIDVSPSGIDMNEQQRSSFKDCCEMDLLGSDRNILDKHKTDHGPMGCPLRFSEVTIACRMPPSGRVKQVSLGLGLVMYMTMVDALSLALFERRIFHLAVQQ